MLRSLVELSVVLIVVNCQQMTGPPEVICNENDILLRAEFDGPFNGRIYPKDLSKVDACSASGNGSLVMEFRVPLFACETIQRNPRNSFMMQFTNIIQIQRHPMLVTGSDLAYMVHCNYELGEKTVSNDVTVEMVATTILPSFSPQLPQCTLRIMLGDVPDGSEVAAPVSLGTPLTFVIEMDQSDVYGFTVSSCIARDGMDMGEQMIIDENGCAVNEDIFGELMYDPANARVFRPFPAHKFPTSMQVYYSCNVKLCLHDQCEIPQCAIDLSGSKKRRKRQTLRRDGQEDPLFIVRDVVQIADFDSNQVNDVGVQPVPIDQIPVKQHSSTFDPYNNEICVPTVGFAIGIALFAGIFLLSLVMSAFLCARARGRKPGSEYENSVMKFFGTAPNYQ